jgi:predicted NUDIX family NTP pyrophosphohydrolase
MELISAGLLMFRRHNGTIEFFLAHPGGPFWKNKDLGAWSIPKGLVDDGEEDIQAAKREFLEETGFPVDGELIALTPVKQKGGKIVVAWAVEGDLDPAQVKSNYYKVQWPPNSGQFRSYPEIDRVEWFATEAALEKINTAQAGLIRELIE